MFIVIGLIAGFILGWFIHSVKNRKRDKGVIGDLVFVTDEDGSYSFIRFDSQDKINNLASGDVISLAVKTQK